MNSPELKEMDSQSVLGREAEILRAMDRVTSEQKRLKDLRKRLERAQSRIEKLESGYSKLIKD